MATILESVAALIDAADVDLTSGTNLFAFRFPPRPNFAVCVYEYEGGSPSFTMTSRTVDQPRLQVVVRGEPDDYLTPRDKAESIRLLLDSTAGGVQSGKQVLRIEPTGTVYASGVDEENRPMVAVRFVAQVERA